jgi:two-component system, cell cycle sensor histidine kinase and response regulator CckA
MDFHSGTPAGADELIAALRRYARDRVPAPGVDAKGDVELSLLHLQKLATVGQLASAVAQEFGNLMTVVLGYSELTIAAVGQGDVPEPEHLAELRLAAERASALTTRLLGYCREATDEAVPLDLTQLVGGLTNMLARLLGSGANLAIRTDRAAGAVIADAKQIEQLVINLILNARDAIANGGRVEVSVDSATLTTPLSHALGTAPAGNYVRLRVRDDGYGMEASTLAQLFQPFFTTKGGAGLGMTVVARVARKSNAAVIVDSAPGKGTTIDLYFPRLDPGTAG